MFHPLKTEDNQSISQQADVLSLANFMYPKNTLFKLCDAYYKPKIEELLASLTFAIKIEHISPPHPLFTEIKGATLINNKV